MKRISPLWFYLLPLPIVIGSLLVGPAGQVTPGAVARWLLHAAGLLADMPDNAELVRAVVLDVRLPRVLLTFLVGASLSASGAALQAIFRNPLVSPYVLGISSGSAFGAALALTIPWLPVQPAAFVFGLLASGASYALARNGRVVSMVSLLLTGVVVSGMFTALLAVVQFIADPFKLQSIVHWTMGNLHNATWSKLVSALPFTASAAAWLWVVRWRVNVLALGDDEARAAGLEPEREKLMVLIPATLLSSASVAVAGVIGMIELAVPHMARMMAGADNARVIPVSFAFGGSFLLVVDDLSRTLAQFEIPIGIFTMLIGGPFFIYLLRKTRIGMQV